MVYENIVKGKFIARPNRFIAEIEIEGKKEKAHVKNTGRCRELLIPGATVYLEDFCDKMGTRKMRYSLIAVEKNGQIINMDSQAPNKAVHEALLNGNISLSGLSVLETVRPETRFGNSRFDFYVKDKDGREGFIEVKGCTLEEGGIARFPDAPTERGIKHLQELSLAKAEGYYAAIIFVIQMKGIRYFEPNYATHPAFGETLKNVKESGVDIICLDCIITENTMSIDKLVPYMLRQF